MGRGLVILASEKTITGSQGGVICPLHSGNEALFADPEFDGEPALITEEEMDATGTQVEVKVVEPEKSEEPDDVEFNEHIDREPGDTPPKKYYVDKGSVEIAAHLVYELDGNGKQLRVVKFTDYTADRVRSMYPSAAILRSKWSDAEERTGIIQALEDRGISFDELVAAANQPEADPFDLLCHVAFNAPLRTRRERADILRKEKKDFFEQYGADARQILTEMLDKYIEYGTAQFQIPEILKFPPISDRGSVLEIAGLFGGADKLRSAVQQMQAYLYAS